MTSFSELIGQDRAVELLQQAVVHNRIAYAYLFAGPSGVGRSLAAKFFISLLMRAGLPEKDHPPIQKQLDSGNHPDLLWVKPTYLHQGKLLSPEEAAKEGLKRKAPPQIRIEQIRQITQFLSRPPLKASRSVVVIEDAQTMAEAPANALLKTLEEPGRATLILIAPGTDSLLPTLVSRCQRIPFYRLPSEDLERILQKLGYHEILEHPELLAIASGSPGEAIHSQAQLMAIPEDLLEKLKKLPKNTVHVLALAKEVAGTLDTETQLWLVDYLQHHYWQKWKQKSAIEQLEKARNFLLSYAQPRLVWECTLLQICPPY